MNLELHKKYNYLKNHLNQNKMKVNYTKKQTSVEFFSDKVCEIVGWIPQTVDQAKALLEALEQAKEIEEKQRQEDINRGYLEGYDDGTKGKEPIMPRPLYVCESSYTEIPLDKNGKPIII